MAANQPQSSAHRPGLRGGGLADVVANLWRAACQSRGRMAAVVAALCMIMAVPGILRLPAVDRTEIVYADTTRAMVDGGDWLDPRYHGEVHDFRPIGTFWAQGIAASIADAVGGAAALHDISVYRLPGLTAVTISAVAIVIIAAPVVGVSTAGLAALLFAVAPLTVLLAQLAIAEGLSLAAATIAMLALLRIYLAPQSQPTRGLAITFWIAVGFGVLINALMLPLLVLSTVVGLWWLDRDLSWLRRLAIMPGLIIVVLLAAPWIVVRANQDGVAFANMSWRGFFEAMTGSQDMKLRAMPGTFLLAAVVGFLPGTALLAPAGLQLWRQRTRDPQARFLLAWIIGHLVFCELLSSEPGTYSVQVIFPAMALAVAGFASSYTADTAPRYHGAPWPILAGLGAVALFAIVLGFTQTWPTLLGATLIAIVATLFYLSAEALRRNALWRWAAAGVAGLGLFAVTLLAVVLPNVNGLWPARELARAVASCPRDGVALYGFREPSAAFVLGARRPRTGEELVSAMNGSAARISIIEDRRLAEVEAARQRQGLAVLPAPSACVTVYNVMRGCPLRFKVFETVEAPRCTFAEAFDCASQPPPPPYSSKDCS